MPFGPPGFQGGWLSRPQAAPTDAVQSFQTQTPQYPVNAPYVPGSVAETLGQTANPLAFLGSAPTANRWGTTTPSPDIMAQFAAAMGNGGASYAQPDNATGTSIQYTRNPAGGLVQSGGPRAASAGVLPSGLQMLAQMASAPAGGATAAYAGPPVISGSRTPYDAPVAAGGSGGFMPPAPGAARPPSYPNLTPEQVNDFLTNKRFDPGSSGQIPIDDAMLQAISDYLGLVPGLQLAQTGRLADKDTKFRGEIPDALSGPLFSGDPYELFGSNTAGGQLGNLLYQNALNQGQRGAQADQALSTLQGAGAASPAYLASLQGLSTLQANPFTTSSSALYNENLNQGVRDIEQGRQTSNQQLQDMGFGGMGPAGADAFNANNANANRQRADFGLSLRNLFAQNRATDIEKLMGAAGQGANVFGQQVTQPSALYAEQLRQPANAGLSAFADYLASIAEAQTGKELTLRRGTVFDQIAPLLGSIIGAGGQALGAPRTTTNNIYGG